MLVQRDRSHTSGQPTYSKEKVTQVTVSVYVLVRCEVSNTPQNGKCLFTYCYVSRFPLATTFIFLSYAAMYEYTAVQITTDMRQFGNNTWFFHNYNCRCFNLKMPLLRFEMFTVSHSHLEKNRFRNTNFCCLYWKSRIKLKFCFFRKRVYTCTFFNSKRCVGTE